MAQAPPKEHSRDDLFDSLRRERAGPRGEAAADLARRLLGRGSSDFLSTRSAEDVVDTISRLFGMLDATPHGRVAVRTAWDPEDPTYGVLQTVTDDSPFIVDTLREYVHSLGLDIPALMHPVVVVERDSDGRVVAIRDRGEGDRPTSLVHITMEGAIDDDVRAGIADAVRERLRQIGAVTADWQLMLERCVRIREELEEKKDDLPWRKAEVEEVQELLRWLEDPGFVFLGYRRYDIEVDEQGRHWARVGKGTGLGILRDEGRSRYSEAVAIDDLPAELRARILAGPLLIISKTNAESPIRRRAQMDYIGIKRVAPDGTVLGEHRFLGLLTAKAFNQDASTIPILRRKVREILELEGAPRGSHNYNIILQTFNSMPKEELFLSTVEELRAVIEAVMETEGADDVRVTARPDSLGRGYNVMVILPKSRFSAAVRKRLQTALTESYSGRLLNYHLALGQGDQARLHFYVSHDPERPAPDADELERIVRETVRSWEEKLADELLEAHDAATARELADRYAEGFSSEYRAAFGVRDAVRDIGHLDAHDRTDALQASVSAPADERRAVFRLKIFAREGDFVLSDLIPILENLGFRVLDAYRFRVSRRDAAAAATIHAFDVETAIDAPVDVEAAEEGIGETLRALREEKAENDRLNSLILSADLGWREVALLRAYAGYAFRVGAVVSRQGAIRPLTRHPRVASLLFDAFASRFDPDLEEDRDEAWRRIHDRYTSALGDVRGIEDDRTLRRLLALVQATQRTNYFRDPAASASSISLKFDCRAVDFMPYPRPHHEVYLRSARTEAAHLRMGDVARGGIRWSDRREDFRVEVLGLVKTQRVKNAVIVPTGAKGAFIARRLPDDPAARTAAALESYREFIRGLLELTDNIVDGTVVHPDRVVVHDGADPYLVVAADKGTAKNSDAANALAREVGFWLGDAFASGGSRGYDHKAEGITARGAWECVKRHFREMDLDFERETFTAVGIGDMSGDVFGNGMLLSRRVRLLAAFDHRHVFVDPDPDPEAGWEGRSRLFALPTSSWEDYDTGLISEGGGVFERTSKAIQLSPQVREALDIREETLNGEELIRAILQAPVDLLWNGGIGTYVKATSESHGDVGDPSDDGVRVDATDVRARVIGEGGNLGLTQRARIEYALLGGRLNTDALDNSAGVDMSDHEVNLKILLDAAVRRGSLSSEDRDAVLEACTDAVSEAVLRNNYTQSLAISLDDRRARSSLLPFCEAMERVEREGLLDPGLEYLPTLEELYGRESEGIPLTRPELAILLAYSKLHLKSLLVSSRIGEDAAMLELMRAYFPPRALEVVSDEDLEAHPLRANLVSTILANRFVDRMGTAAHIQLMSETDCAAATVVRTWHVASAIADSDELYERIRATDATTRTGAQYQWYLDMADALGRATSWLLHRSDLSASISDSIEALREPVRAIRASLDGLLIGERLEAFESRRALHEMDGLDSETAGRLATMRYLDEFLPIASLAVQTGAEAADVAAVYLGLAEEIDFPWMRGRLDQLANGELWANRGARILAARLEDARLGIAARILEGLADSPERALERFRHANAVDLGRIRNVLSEIRSADRIGLASLLVAVDAVSELNALDQA